MINEISDQIQLKNKPGKTFSQPKRQKKKDAAIYMSSSANVGGRAQWEGAHRTAAFSSSMESDH